MCSVSEGTGLYYLEDSAFCSCELVSAIEVGEECEAIEAHEYVHADLLLGEKALQYIF